MDRPINHVWSDFLIDHEYFQHPAWKPKLAQRSCESKHDGEQALTHVGEQQLVSIVHVVHHSDALTHPHILFGVWAQQQSLWKTQ